MVAPVISSKNVLDAAGNTLASTNTTQIIALQEDPIGVSGAGVSLGSKVNGIFLSIFFYADAVSGTDLPLIDWYIMKDPGSTFGSIGFSGTGYPTPGSVATYRNRKWIIHEEKGLTGAASDGYPMVFKGVIALPRHMRRFGETDALVVNFRTELPGKHCIKAIYRYIR